MNEDVSLISMHPFFRKFVFSIVQTIKERNFRHEERVVVDADFVPKISERVMMASMGAGVSVPAVEKHEPRVVVKRDMSELVAPIRKMSPSLKIRQVAPSPVVMPPTIQPQTRRVAPPIKTTPVVAPKVVVAPIVISVGTIDEGEKYGKISPLLNDVSISTIECLGKDKELMIIRAGQKQRTRIVLSADEIKEILSRVADEAHIPLLEGVFRASVSGFSMNAVISEIIGSRFVIKKATAYGLLE